MVSLCVDDEVREAAAEFKKATGDLRHATDVGGAVKKAGQSLRDEVAGPQTSPASTGPPPVASDPGEAGGPPADRLVEDGGAEPPPTTDPTTPPRSEDPPSGARSRP
jgi:hypothetical protein